VDAFIYKISSAGIGRMEVILKFIACTNGYRKRRHAQDDRNARTNILVSVPNGLG
jgi:hypothetical protein